MPPPSPPVWVLGVLSHPYTALLAVKALLMLLGWHTLVVGYVPPLEVLSAGAFICVAARHPWKCCVPVKVGFEVFFAEEFSRLAKL